MIFTYEYIWKSAYFLLNSNKKALTAVSSTVSALSEIESLNTLIHA